MKTHFLNREQFVKEAEFSASDVEKIKQCRHDYTPLGFGYQLACVRVLNRFPAQKPLEIIDDILTFVSLQLGMSTSSISQYERRHPTVSKHQEAIRHYLGLSLFDPASADIASFIFKESYILEQTGALIARLRDFLKQNHILEPSQDTMSRIVQTQREAARTAIYDKISGLLCGKMSQSLDALISTDVDNAAYSPLHFLNHNSSNFLSAQLHLIRQGYVFGVPP